MKQTINPYNLHTPRLARMVNQLVVQNRVHQQSAYVPVSLLES